MKASRFEASMPLCITTFLTAVSRSAMDTAFPFTTAATSSFALPVSSEMTLASAPLYSGSVSEDCYPWLHAIVDMTSSHAAVIINVLDLSIGFPFSFPVHRAMGSGPALDEACVRK